MCGMQGYETAFYSWHFTQEWSPLVLTARYQLSESVSAFSDKAINFMPLVFMVSDQFHLKRKLIFSFLSLLVWNALGNYRLFWLFLFLNSLDWNPLMSLHITENTLPLSLYVLQLWAPGCAFYRHAPQLERPLRRRTLWILIIAVLCSQCISRAEMFALNVCELFGTISGRIDVGNALS